MVHQVKLYSENGETIGIFSCYPKEAEEGFGVRIRTIIDTFEWDIKWQKQDDENVDRLLEWIMSEEGQYIIEETGYVGVSSN